MTGSAGDQTHDPWVTGQARNRKTTNAEKHNITITLIENDEYL